MGIPPFPEPLTFEEMNTILGRLNAVTAYALTVLAFLTFLCFLTTCLKTKTLENVEVTPSPEIAV